MEISAKLLNFFTWTSIIYIAIFGLVGPVVIPIYRKMEGLPEYTQNPWLMLPPAIVTVIGCWLILSRRTLGYILIVLAAGLAFLISPSPYQNLVPVYLVSIPFWATVYYVNKQN